MAIIDQLGIKVTVVVDDAALVEYEDPEPEKTDNPQTKYSHKYVASQDNKEFSISITSTENLKWAGEKVDFGLCFEVFIDGREINCLVAKPEDLEKGSFNYRIEGLVEQNGDGDSITLRKCRFSPIFLVDNADEATTTDEMKMGRDMGLIRVLVSRERIQTESECSTECGESPSPPPPSGLLNPLEAPRVAEEDVKGMAISHITHFSPAVHTTEHLYDCIDTETLDESPLADFRFKYCSIEILEDLLKVRGPSDLHVDDICPIMGLDQLSKSEILKLAMERLKQKQRITIKAEPDQQAMTKRKLSDFNDMADTPSEPREKKRVFIDLTDEI